MFEPGTSKGSSDCIFPKNGHIEANNKGEDCSKKSTKKDLIESLVSDAANKLGVKYVLNKKPKDVQNETSKKRNSCSALLLEKPQSSKRQRLSCEAKICNTKVQIDALSLNCEDLTDDGNVNDYLVMVNKQLKALQELPIIQKSSMSKIQDFISKLDESQVENFLRKKADGIQSLVGSDQNAKSIFSFIQKKLILPVYEKRSSVEVPSNHGDDTSLAGPSSDNSSKKAIEVEIPKSDKQELLVDIFQQVCLPESASTNTEGLKTSDKSGANPTSDDASEVTSTTVVENEVEVTSSSSSELVTIQSKVLEKINSSDVFKLDHKELLELFNCNDGGRHSESVLVKVAEVLNLKDASMEEIKIALKKDIRKFFLWMISFADMLKTCTDILTKPDSNVEVNPTVEKNLTVKCIEAPLNNQESNTHCQCCVLKSKEDTCKVTNLNSTITEQPENEGKPSNLSSPENNATTSASSEETLEKVKISPSTTLDAQIASPATSSSIEAIKIKTDKIKDEIFDDSVIISDDESPNGKIFKCKKCDYTTKSKIKLKRHVKYAKKNPLVYNHKKRPVKKSEN